MQTKNIIRPKNVSKFHENRLKKKKKVKRRRKSWWRSSLFHSFASRKIPSIKYRKIAEITIELSIAVPFALAFISISFKIPKFLIRERTTPQWVKEWNSRWATNEWVRVRMRQIERQRVSESNRDFWHIEFFSMNDEPLFSYRNWPEFLSIFYFSFL